MSNDDDGLGWIDADDVLGGVSVGYCGRCGRLTWRKVELGTVDNMPQPDGGPCGGVFESK